VDYDGNPTDSGVKLNRIRVDETNTTYCLFPQLTEQIIDTTDKAVQRGKYLKLVDTNSESTIFSGIYEVQARTATDLSKWTKWYITATITVNGKDYVYPVTVNTINSETGTNATVKILDVSDEDDMYRNQSSYVVPIQSEAPTETGSTAIAVADGDTTYYTNGDSSLGLIGSKVTHNATGDDTWNVEATPSLLFDSELGSDEYPDYNDGKIQDTLSEDYSSAYNAENYEIRYLDLVNANDGNARLTLADEDDKVTVYWPYPEGTDRNSYNFTLLHFMGYDREDALVQNVPDEASDDGDGGDTDTADKSSYIVLSSADGSLEATEYGIKFTTHTFSPFVLLWERKPVTPGIISTVPGSGDDTETAGTEITDTEGVDKIKDPNTEEDTEGDTEIGDEENDRVNSANNNINNDDGDGGTTIIDRVRAILPKTGDTTAVMLWILIMIICIAGAAAFVKIAIKKRR
jgi:hypothetical protein